MQGPTLVLPMWFQHILNFLGELLVDSVMHYKGFLLEHSLLATKN